MKNKTNKPANVHKKVIDKERNCLLNNITRFGELPLLILGFIWLALLIMELLNRSNRFLNGLNVTIWIIFIVDFVVKYTLSTSRMQFLKKNILTAISLIIPAFRILRFVRILRLIRISRGIRLVKVLGSLNRGMNSLASLMKRRAFGYVIAFTIIVMFVGAAGSYAFEKDVNSGFESYSSALWRTAMLIMNMGTEWLITPEGRILYLIIAIYSLAVLGYITATLASFFIDRDSTDKSAKSSTNQMKEIMREIQMLRQDLQNQRKA